LEIEPDAVKLFRANNNTNTIQSALTAAHNSDSRRVVLVEHIDDTVSDSNQQVGEGEGEEAESWWCDLGKNTGARVDTDDSKASEQKDESARIKFERDLEIISEDWDKMVALADDKKKRNKDNSTSGPLTKVRPFPLSFVTRVLPMIASEVAAPIHRRFTKLLAIYPRGHRSVDDC